MSGFGTKSKGANTFRFKSFAERVNEIDIRQTALYRIGHENEELEEADETFFTQTVRKWTVLNLTGEYGTFCKKCQNIVTLPQLLYKKDFVLELICDTLGTATTLSLEPVLDALVAFSKDLREEFYPYFERVLDKLVGLLLTQDPDQLEWTLKCLALLFKSLRPFLKRNIDVVLNKVVPLLDNATYPEHVINFASECFSFVARDIKNYDKFLLLTVKTVQNQNNGVAGCGTLFFELIRGVNGDFHTVAGDILKVIFNCFQQPQFDQEILFEIVTQTIADMLRYIQPCKMSLFWNVITDSIDLALDQQGAANTEALHRLTKFVRQAAEWKEGKSLIESEKIVGTLVKVVNEIENEVVLLEVGTIVCITLQSNAKISQMDTSRLMRKMLTTSSDKVLDHFVWNICTHPQFDALVLPEFIKRFEKNRTIGRLDLLVKIIWKRTNWNVGCEWVKQPVTLQSTQSYRWLEQNIENCSLKNSSGTDLESFLLSAVFYTHLEGGKPKLVSGLLKDKLELIIDAYKTDLAIALFLTTENLLHIDKNIGETFLGKIIKCVLTDHNSGNVNALRTLIAVFEYAKTTHKKIFTKKLFLEVHHVLSDNLSLNNRILRLMSAQALNYFSELKEVNTVYGIFYDIESIIPTVQTYREQLLLLQKLSPSGQFYKDISLDEVRLDCLKFILGLLYHNFKLLWEPVLKMVQEFAEKMSVDDFWYIYRQKLADTSAAIVDPPKEGSTESSIQSLHYEAIRGLENDFCVAEDKTDFSHYRKLLWKAVAGFGQISEIKNKDIVNMFLEFVNREYKSSEEAHVLTWNILKDNPSMDCADDENSDKAAEKQRPSKPRKKPPVVDTLITMLEVFHKMVNPKQLYREQELSAFYMELLSSTNEQLQKLSLDCILTYKKKAHTAYKDHLYALIDDKKIKQELVEFKLDADSKMIQSDHRADLMPVLLRILYGKMRSRTNNKNIGSQMRRGIVMRFLAGCAKDEIFWFLQMAFVDFEDLLKEECENIPVRVQAELKLEQVWSPKKLQSALNLLELIRKYFGGLMESDFLVFISKIIILIGSICKCVFDNFDNVGENYHAIFRNLRTSCLLSLVNFFDHFEAFVWPREYIRVIFDVFVWPGLDKLPQECLHSPTALLKLFEIWSKNPRHFGWLGEERRDGVTPLGTAMLLLISDKPKPVIRRTIMQIVERLLSAEADTDQQVPSIGITVVEPCVPQILIRLKKTLSSKGSRKIFGKMDLYILSRITEMDLGVDVCDTLLELILPIATGKTRIFMSDDSTSQLVSTLQNLMLKVDKPEKHIRNLTPLFEKVNEVTTRKNLCMLLTRVARKVKSRVSSLEETAKLIENLNAWDRKWVEQPDYDKRLTALRDIKEKCQKNDIEMELGLLVIYNCFYFLHHDKDMGLRDSASECMRTVVSKLVEHYAGNTLELNYLIGDVMLTLVHRTLRDKNDIVRNEGILLLGEMARNCPDAHPVLRDLSRLSCKEDLEVDFFENVTHLQSHRHGRALLKFCAEAKTYESPVTSRTLTQFILPLARRYLMNEKYAGKHTLVDAAVETIGMVCRFLPWHQYHAILKYYLQKMRYSREYHKQCVRILISVLDAFHFDLSNTKELPAEEQCVKPTEPIPEKDAVGQDDETEETGEPDDVDLESELDELPDEDEDVVITTKKTKLTPFIDQLTQLSPSAARRIVHTIVSTLIPSLNHSITELSSYESKHKMNRRRVNFEREEEESLRVPIALAIVKLLQKLPKEKLNSSIQGVFMKVCTFLKSPVKSVRMLTRDILKKIMTTIGTEYLSMLLSQLTALLTRGFQVHVLSVTLYSILDCLKDNFKPGDIAKSLQLILKVTLNDIFGEASVEKEIDKIGIHTPEAKPSTKSFLSLAIAARNVPENCLLDMLLPFKQYLFTTQSKKILVKIQDCFLKIVSGLAENKNISCESLLEFIYGTVSESIPDLIPPDNKLSSVEKELLKRRQPDCFLIAPEPKYRSGAVRKVVTTNACANAHVLIEFGFELLHIILRRKKLDTSEYLNPIVPLLKSSLESQHVRVSTFALKCLISIWSADYAVEVIQEYVGEIVKQLFVILHKYFSFGSTRKDDNFQLVKSAMKAVGYVVRKCDYYSLDKENMTKLLFYIGQDVNDSDKQPVAFSLLRALIDKEMFSSELHEIMRKLCELSVTSESDYAKEEARVVLLNYIMKFYREKKTESVLKFFIAQLNYEIVGGRFSAVKFLQAVIKKYPVEVLQKKSEVIFLAVGTRLVNEDVPECRVLVAECIETLISRLDAMNRQKLFDITRLFFDGKKNAVREMAAALCSRFVEFEKEDFLPKAINILPVLSSHLSLNNSNAAGRFVKASGNFAEKEIDREKDGGNDELMEQSKERVRDHEIIQTQNCIIKILEHCPQVLSDVSLNSTLDDIAYESQRLLGYEHEWVRLNSVKIITAIVATYDFDMVSNCLQNSIQDEALKQFIYSAPENDLKSLTLDLCAQMLPGETSEEIANEILKCLMYIGNMLKLVQNSELDTTPKINLRWLLRRIRYVIHGEVAKAPHSTILRQSLFDWIEGMVSLLDTTTLLDLCPAIIPALVREMSEDDVNIDSKVRQKAMRIANKIRKKIGDELYDKIRVTAQTKLMMKRATRKKDLVQEKILDPVRSAKRKASQQERKKTAKKKKLNIIRGKGEGLRKRKRKNSEDIF